MEAKDVALLGFVSSAKNYINRHINDGTNLDKLNKFDINTLDSELSKQLKHFNGNQDVINSLLNAGSTAFDDFAKDQIENQTNGVLDSLGEIFDIDLEEEKEETAQEETIQEESKQEDVVIQEEPKQEEEVQEETIETKEEELEENNNEPDEFGLTNDDEVLNAIANAASRTNEELEKLSHKVPQDERMDDVFKEVVNEETNPTHEIQEETNVEEVETQEEIKEETKVEETASNNEIGQQQTLSEFIKSLAHKNYANSNKNIEQEEPKYEYATLSQTLKGIAKGNETIYTPEKNDIPIIPNLEINEINEEQESSQLNYIENPGLSIIEPSDAIYDEAKVIEEEPKVIENPGTTFDQGISSSLEALQDFASHKEEVKEVEPDTHDEIFESIAKAYPYLNMSFIKTAYALKDEVSNGFEFGEKIVILHRVNFSEIENLREFVEIIMEHNYSVNVDENKMIVDSFKEFENEDGLILSNIYTMANQAKVLNGEYEGYRVIKEEE